MSGEKESKSTFQSVVDIVIKLLILIALLAWCLDIARPFIHIFLWGMILAITLFPFFEKIKSAMGNRNKLAAAAVTILLLAILILPTILLADSTIDGMKKLRKDLDSQSISIPPPPDNVADWPLVGSRVFASWTAASENLQQFAEKYNEQLLSAGQWFLNALLGTSIGFLQFLLSIIISGILLANAERGAQTGRMLFRKLVAERGDEFADATETTIRNISKGVLGVAAIQSLLLGIIFFVSGVPYAGLWAVLCLVLAVIQIGPGLVAIPVIIFYFATLNTGPAILWTILVILGTLIDNYLKPVLMGKGAPVPMLVIFLGAIGGFMASGFIGLFLGAIILSLGYKLFITWIDDAKEA